MGKNCLFCYNTVMQKTFASRAGDKLAFALETFKINVSDKVCADFGSSVGGFVDCLLQNNAQKVYAVETGYGELAWKLRNNPKVVVLERTNAMHVTLPEQVTLLTNDTSWTKQKNIFPNILRNTQEYGIIITLIKPHYEADKRLLIKGVLTPQVAEEVAKQTVEEIAKMGVQIKGFIQSPLLGGKGGNTEYFAYLQKQ